MLFFFFKQKTAYEMRISDWSSDVCSSDLMMEQSERFGLAIDTILVCCSGGGLAAGVAIAATAMDADVEIYAVEPEGFDDRSEERRVGKECVSTCSSRWAPDP